MRPSDLTAATWRKSSRSGGGNGSQCVELALLADRAGIRDSKAVPTAGGMGVELGFPRGVVTAFVAAVRLGELDQR